MRVAVHQAQPEVHPREAETTATQSACQRNACSIARSLAVAAPGAAPPRMERPLPSSRLGTQPMPLVRLRCASNRITAAATETFSEPTFPRTGIETSSSQAEATRGLKPLPSDPITSTALPLQSTAVYSVLAFSSAP